MGIYVEADPFALKVVRPVTAGGGPLAPPDEWFEDPHLDGPTPLTVTSDGRVYGHLAAWDTVHIGMPGRVRPPRSRSDYAYFKTGMLRTASGKDVAVGQLTLSGGHAPIQADARAAAKHYDDTGSAFADVSAGEDRYGIWLAGALRPEVTDAQVRAIRASAPSGDWRPIGGALELVAACQVNVPGFPIPRAMARVASGQVLALVAAGASDMYLRKMRALDNDVIGRLDAIEGALESLVAATFSTEQREDLADKGEAMPDGSYPIRNKTDLKNAVQAYGRAKNPEKAKAWIIKRAKALDAVDLLPEDWGVQASAGPEDVKAQMRARVFGIPA